MLIVELIGLDLNDSHSVLSEVQPLHACFTTGFQRPTYSLLYDVVVCGGQWMSSLMVLLTPACLSLIIWSTDAFLDYNTSTT